MPTVYRSMKRDDDGLPRVGSNSSELGVRVPPNPHADVDLDENGFVVLNEKGMSVVEHWSRLPPWLIPTRLKPLAKDARGSDALSCYRIGDGPFEPKPLNDSLALALKPHDPLAGVVAPLRTVPAEQYQKDLAATRDDWVSDENMP